jgi:hypothetical protein
MDRTTCSCVHPIEDPDGMCGRCRRRRLGEDLSPRQFAELVEMLERLFAAPFEDDDRADRPARLVRVRGRKRPWGLSP